MGELISQLGIDARMILAQLFNFILLLIVLERFVYRPVIKVVDERKKQIEENNKREERLELKLKEMHSVRENILTEAREESEKIRDEALKRAEETRNHILAEAEKKAESLVEAERRQFRSEIDRIEESIKAEVGVLLTKVVEKTVGDVLDDKMQEKILSRSIEDFKSEYSTKDFRGVIELKPKEGAGAK